MVNGIEGERERPVTSPARKALVVLCAAHGVTLVGTALNAPSPAGFGGLAGLALLNVLALAGLATRSRLGWWVACLFVLVAAVRWTFGEIDGGGGLLVFLGIAAGVFFVTDPSLRREHGIAA